MLIAMQLGRASIVGRAEPSIAPAGGSLDRDRLWSSAEVKVRALYARTAPVAADARCGAFRTSLARSLLLL